MIEEIILNHFIKKASVPCYMEEPIKPPSKYILLEKTGSGQNDRLFTAMFAVKSHGQTMLEAAEVNDEAIGIMLSANELPEITRVRLNSDYNFTDLTTKRYRYQAVFNLTFYREDY